MGGFPQRKAPTGQDPSGPFHAPPLRQDVSGARSLVLDAGSGQALVAVATRLMGVVSHDSGRIVGRGFGLGLPFGRCHVEHCRTLPIR